MQFTPIFDPYLPTTDIPAFERVKGKGENPGYNYEFIDFACSNISGVQLHNKGWTMLTPIYRTTLYCDVCELPVQEAKVHGKTREVHVDSFADIANDDQIKRELERGDQGVFKELKKYVNFSLTYNSQCSRCGRWPAKGNEHKQCVDEVYGICKYCANIMREILG